MFGSYSRETVTRKSDVDLFADCGGFVGVMEDVRATLGEKEVDMFRRIA